MTARLAAVLLAVAQFSAPAAADPTILLETFEDDTIASFPGTPEVGTVSYTGARHEIFDSGAGKRLMTTCLPPDGTSATWQTLSASNATARLHYLAGVRGADPVSDSIARADTVALWLSGGTVEYHQLSWWDDGEWSAEAATLGTYSFGTAYDVVWELDTVADTLSLSVDGVSLHTFATDPTATEIYSFEAGCTGSLTTDLETDDISVVSDPIFLSGFDLASPGEWSAWSPATVVGDTCDVPGLLGQGIDTPGTLAGHGGAIDHSEACGSGDTFDRWMLYRAQCTGTATVTTCLPGTEFDTVLAVYDGCGGTQLACNDDTVGSPAACDLSGGNRKSTTSFSVIEGTTYPVRVSVYEDTFPSPDDKEFEVRVECAPAP